MEVGAGEKPSIRDQSRGLTRPVTLNRRENEMAAPRSVVKNGKADGRPRAAGAKRTSPADVGLAFMLARQGMTRLRFNADRLHLDSRGARDSALLLMEAQLGLQQTRALTERLQPFTRSRDLAVRFEAQELLVALERVNETIGRTVSHLRPPQRRHASEIDAALRARLR